MMRELLEQLFRRYYREVYHYLYGLSHDAQLAEDLTSEVFVEVVRSIALFRGESDIRTWLFSIARHRWFAWLRKKNRDGSQEEFREFLTADGKSLEEQVHDRDTVQRVSQILDSEPERTRKIILMRADGYSFCEIAKEVGISESSARVIHFRAKEKIRKILREEGF